MPNTDKKIDQADIDEVLFLISRERERRLLQADPGLDPASDIPAIALRVLDDLDNRIIPGLIGHA